MAVLKCKMCGGTMEMTNESVAVCEYCGTQQTVPTVQDTNLQGLFNRANALRIKCEFDKAEQLYEKIISADNTLAEAYWGLILCKYGIEYVEDPVTFKRIPTCHRTSFDSIIADEDYNCAIDFADAQSQELYISEAKEIDRLQKEILALSKKEDPYDVFICYKETDETGKRTIDSVIANDIYYQLTQEGFKVFYAAITLEDKLGSAYEPCIFAALNSSKVMLAIGTKPEYFNAVWVKNEWSRFLKMMKKDRQKLLIPCYRDMDAYELPDEFAHLQAQDMSKIGFINDVVRGIKKVIVKEEAAPVVVQETLSSGSNTNIAPLMERIFMFLEDGDFNSADEYCEKVLDKDPKCAQAYLGKLMVQTKVKEQSQLINCPMPFEDNNNYQKILRFGDQQLIGFLDNCIAAIKERNENTRKENMYNEAIRIFNGSTSEQMFLKAKDMFLELGEYKDSAAYLGKAFDEAETVRKNRMYKLAIATAEEGTKESFDKAITILEEIRGFGDVDELLQNRELFYQKTVCNKVYSEASRNLNLALENIRDNVLIEQTVVALRRIKNMFLSIADYKNSSQLAKDCDKYMSECEKIELNQLYMQRKILAIELNSCKGFFALKEREDVQKAIDKVERRIDVLRKNIKE